jgi:hypothetical protein
MIIWYKKLHKDDLRTIETWRSFDGLYVKIRIILKYGVFDGIS